MEKEQMKQRIKELQATHDYHSDCIDALNRGYDKLREQYEELRAMVIDNLIESMDDEEKSFSETLKAEIDSAVTIATVNVAKKFGFPQRKAGR